MVFSRFEVFSCSRFKIQPWAARLGEPEKSVNKISKFILEGAENKGICLGKRGKTTGKENDWEGEKERKGRIAKGYLGLQGTSHDK